MRLVSLLLIFVACVATSFATQSDIHSANDFVTLVNKAANGDFNDDIVLWVDLDFEDDILRGIVDRLPLGMKNSSYCTPYSGTFDGRNNSVKNLKLEDKERSGLICDSSNALIKNLVIDKTCSFSGNFVGGLSVYASGPVSLQNIKVYGKMHGKTVGGGMIGTVKTLNSGFVSVEDCYLNCTVVYELNSATAAGGFIGSISSCTNSFFSFSKNDNDGVVSAPSSPSQQCQYISSGGFVGLIKADNKNITIYASENTNNVLVNSKIEDCTNSHYVGGFFGNIQGTDLRVTAENNLNAAVLNIETSGRAYAGGYIGFLSVSNGALIMNENTNNGDMFYDKPDSGLYYGCFVGYLSGNGEFNTVFEGNTNNGDVHITILKQTSDSAVGGYGGYFVFSTTGVFSFNNNTNNGDIIFEGGNNANYYTLYGSGFVGYLYSSGESGIVYQVHFYNNTNNGNILCLGTSSYYLGAVVGSCSLYGSAEAFFHDNINKGNVTTESAVEGNTCRASGLIGYLYSFSSQNNDHHIQLVNNINTGTIQSTGSSNYYIGGFLAFFSAENNGWASFYNNTNMGRVTIDSLSRSYASYVGGILGHFKSVYSSEPEVFHQILFNNNTNTGDIVFIGSSFYVGGLWGYYQMKNSGDFHFNNNTNTGDITVEANHTSYNARRVGGFIGDYEDLGSQHRNNRFVDNINRGNILVISNQSSPTHIGGFCGYYSETNTVSTYFRDIINYGSIDLETTFNSYNGIVGGFVGEFSSSGKEIRLSGIVNNGNVNTIGSSYYFTGGIFGKSTISGGRRVDCDSVANNGNIIAYTKMKSSTSYIGGFGGQVSFTCSEGVVFSNNRNKGNLHVDGQDNSCSFTFYVGGFGGSFSILNSPDTRFYGNINEGKVELASGAYYYAGGLTGYCSLLGSEVLYVYNNGNSGDLFAETSRTSSQRSYIGGLIGQASLSSKNGTHFYNNNNKGKIGFKHNRISFSGNYQYLGGIAGYLSSSSRDNYFHHNENSGYIGATDASYYYTGGLLGYCSLSGQEVLDFYGNVNNADVNAESMSNTTYTSYVGGVCGDLSLNCPNKIQLYDITNNGEVKTIGNSDVHLGGIVGRFVLNKPLLSFFNNSTNNGNLYAIFENNTKNSYIGGFAGYASFTGSSQSQFCDNNNEGNVDVRAANTSSLSVSGFIGYLSLGEITDIEFNTNINNGILRTVGAFGSTKCGGMVGALVPTFSDTKKLRSFRAVENKNNGDTTLDLSKCPSSTVSHHVGIGGLIGTLPFKTNFSARIENNMNTGSIEGTIQTGSVFVGGVVGEIPSKGEADFVGNTNNATIKITCPEVDDYQSFIGGILGMYPNSSMIKMVDNANYGNIISECIRHEVGTCGLVCSAGGNSGSGMVIENCVNHGGVEGIITYGISDFVTKANNVVNLGEVSGTKEGYSIWKEVRDSATSVYCANDKCANCDKSVKAIALDKSDGRYHVVEDSKVIVDEALNDEVDKKGYKMRWDKELQLRRFVYVYIGSPVDRKVIVCSGLSMEESGVPEDIFKYHLIPEGKSAKEDNEVKKTTIIEEELHLVPYFLVTISGAVNEKLYIGADKKHNLGDTSKKLKEYLQSKDYAIGNIDTNELFKGDATVNGDMNIKVMTRNTVVIEMERESVLATDVNANKIAKEISVLTDIDINSILVDIVIDDKGYVLRVIVILENVEMSETLVSAISNIVKNNSQCTVGVLCRSREARIVVPGQNISGCVRDSQIKVLLLSILFTIAMKTVEL